jgi:arginine:ornithine antiporter/lysine permease
MTSVLIQIMLFVTLASEDAFNFMLNMTSALSLIPFVLAAGYALKIGVARDGYVEQPEGRTRDLIVAAIATFYTVFLLYAAGTKYILVSFIIYAPGTILFVMARREQARKLFSPVELVILAVSVIGAVIGVIALVVGWITI